MKRTLLAILLMLAAFAAAGAAQTQINPATQVYWPAVTGAGAPATSCTQLNYGQPYTDTSANAQYVCGSAGWQAVGGGSGTPGGSIGAVQYNANGDFGGVNITGLVYGNGASAPSTATTANVATLLRTASGCTTMGNVYSPQSNTCISSGSASGFPITLGSTTLAASSTTTAVDGLTVDGVTPTTMGYVDPTSSVQTQLNGKQASGNYVTALTGDGSASGPGSAALTLATVNDSPGACGDATHVCAVTTNGKGLVTVQAAVAITAGTVTSFSAGDFAPLFTTTVDTATTTPALSFTASSAAQNSVLAGPASGGAGAYSFQTAPTFSAANLTSFPTLNQNTTGTAANLSGTPALPNGTTGTTQTTGDNTTKLATDAFVSAALPTALPPNGPAGGDLTGTYPDPSLSTVNSGPGACGDATHVCAVTTNGKGLVVAQSAVAITAGTVTSVAQTFTGGLVTVAGSPITASGTLALTVAGTSGGVPYFSSASAWASSGLLTQYGVLVGGGSGGAPTSTAAGAANMPLIGKGSANPAFATIAYPTTATSGGVPYFSSATAISSSAALTHYGVVYGGGAGASPVATAADTTVTHALFATSTAPAFRAILSTDIPTLNQNTTGTAANLSGTPALPNGTTGTTQTTGDNTTKLATDAFVLANVSGSPAWSSIVAPTASLALSMGSYGSVFTSGSATGTGDLWEWTDTASNTGTGILAHFATQSGSAETPWRADADGVGWEVDANGVLKGVGSTTTHGISIPSSSGGLPAPVAGMGGLFTDSSGNVWESDAGGTFYRLCTSGNGQCSPGVANTTTTVGTTAISANSCSTVTTVTMTGLTTSMTVQFTPTSDIHSVTGWGPATPGLYIIDWPSASNTLSYYTCNSSGSSITPGSSVTFNVSAK